MGAPIFIASTAQAVIAQSTTPTNISVPAGAQVGDLLVAVIAIAEGSTGSIIYPAGWTEAVRDVPNTFRHSQALSYFIHTGAASYGFACAERAARIRMLCLRDVNQTTPITASSSKVVVGSDPNTANQLTVSQPNSIELVSFVNLDGSGVLVTSAAGMTSRVNSSTYVSLDIADAAVSVGTTPVRTITQANSTTRSIANLVIVGTVAGTTPIAFTGTIPDQIFTNGDVVNVPFAGYFSGTETPFTFANTGTASAGTGLSIDSAGNLVGTATTGGITGAICTGTDADTNTASSNAFNITVNAAGSPPSGTVTLGTPVGITTSSAAIPYSYSASDQTGFEYRVDGGSAITVTTDPLVVTGLTASTAYTVEMRAINASGNGSWSAPANFTTLAPAGTITNEDLSRNNGAATGVVSLTHVDVRLQSTGALVVRKTGVSTNSSSIFSFSDAAITTGSTYIVSWLESGGQFGIAYNVVAS